MADALPFHFSRFSLLLCVAFFSLQRFFAVRADGYATFLWLLQMSSVSQLTMLFSLHVSFSLSIRAAFSVTAPALPPRYVFHCQLTPPIRLIVDFVFLSLFFGV